jgi:hypothetical protein
MKRHYAAPAGAFCDHVTNDVSTGVATSYPSGRLFFQRPARQRSGSGPCVAELRTRHLLRVRSPPRVFVKKGLELSSMSLRSGLTAFYQLTALTRWRELPLALLMRVAARDTP